MKVGIDTDGLLDRCSCGERAGFFAKCDRIGMVCVWLLTGAVWAGVIYLFVMWRRLEGEA
jgi:D-alanyl-lipoteichoic acid acyltransferase DltB (MBOAT superfamily)